MTGERTPATVIRELPTRPDREATLTFNDGESVTVTIESREREHYSDPVSGDVDVFVVETHPHEQSGPGVSGIEAYRLEVDVAGDSDDTVTASGHYFEEPEGYCMTPPKGVASIDLADQ